MSSETKESLFDVGDGIKLWYRTWGNSTGIPVLFVHGGPGNCVADYDGINEKFFNKEQYFVVEIDQRGTGNSLPSVRDGHKNMPMYKDISITQMAADFEKIRQELGKTRLFFEFSVKSLCMAAPGAPQKSFFLSRKLSCVL